MVSICRLCTVKKFAHNKNNADEFSENSCVRWRSILKPFTAFRQTQWQFSQHCQCAPLGREAKRNENYDRKWQQYLCTAHTYRVSDVNAASTELLKMDGALTTLLQYVFKTKRKREKEKEEKNFQSPPMYAIASDSVSFYLLTYIYTT